MPRPLLMLITVAGCAFVTEATTLSLAVDAVGTTTDTARLTVKRINEELLEIALASRDGVALQLPPGSSWLELRDLLCNAFGRGLLDTPGLEFDEEELDDRDSPNLLGIEISVRVDRGPEISCQAAGLRLDATVTFLPFTKEQAEDLEDRLAITTREIVAGARQLRVRFDLLGLAQFPPEDDGARSSTPTALTNDLLHDFRVELVDPAGEDDPATRFDEARLELVPFFLLPDIAADDPQRFELDPLSPVTHALLDAIASPGEGRLQLELSARVARDELRQIPVDDSGIAMTFEVEIVTSLL